MNEHKAIKVVYTNYKGVSSVRTITPFAVFWGNNEWHPESQWLMDVFDHDKQEARTFAVRDMDFLHAQGDGR